jgi:hypothetical protein
MGTPKPSKVKKGQCWRDKDGNELSVEEVVPGVGCHLMYVPPIKVGGLPISNRGWVDPAELLNDPGWTFLGGPGK